jgi:hypothetical protein
VFVSNERVGVTAILLAYIREVLDSNLDRNTTILIEVLHGFSQPLQENAGVISLSGHGHFLPNHFQFIIIQ